MPQPMVRTTTTSAAEVRAAAELVVALTRAREVGLGLRTLREWTSGELEEIVDTFRLAIQGASSSSGVRSYLLLLWSDRSRSW